MFGRIYYLLVILISSQLILNAQITYEYCRHVNKPIPDLGTVTDTINVPANFYFTYLTVKLDTIFHTWVSDLVISIRKNNNITATLVQNCGGSGNNFINANLIDTSSVPICSAPPPFSGYYKPTQPLSAFNGILPQGQWILTITDNSAGDSGFLKAWCITFVNVVSGINKISSEMPDKFSLSQNYPNPFNPNSKIKFEISKLSKAKLVVYDILGREVQTRVKEELSQGTYEVDFDGSGLPSGVYYYKISAGGFNQTKRMVLVK